MRPRRAAVAVVVGAVSMATVACSDEEVEVPSPGGTESPTSDVRAPNGTTMGAPPINAGTPAP